MRTASLVPRARENPIGIGHWFLAFAVTGGLFAVIASRGFYGFGPDGAAAQAARFRWLIMTSVFGFCCFMMAFVLPFSIARTQTEPEPLDPAGSPELIDMYRKQRVVRSRGLFWLLGVVQPLLLGGVMAAVVWLPEADGRLLGLIGGLGGSIVGIAGAAFGCVSALRGMRIAEARQKLERQAGDPSLASVSGANGIDG